MLISTNILTIPTWLRSRPVFFFGLVSLLIIAAVYVPHLGTIFLTDLGEEAKRAIIARHMMESGDYLIPYLSENIYTKKPPGYNWFICLTSLLGGGEVTVFSARLTSVISMALLMMIMLFATRHVLAFSGQAMLVLATMLSPFMVYKGTLAESEMTFTLTVTAALWTWFMLDAGGKRGFALWALPAALAALSFMIKREPGLVFYFLSIYSYLIYKKRWREIFSVSQFAGVGLALGLIGLWIGYLVAHTSPAFVWSSYIGELSVHVNVVLPWTDMLKRYLVFPVEMFGYLLPCSLLLIPLGFKAVHRSLFERYGNAYIFCVCVLVVNFPVYWFTTTRTKYLMPIYPTLFILGAMVFETYLKQPGCLPPRVLKFFEKLTWGIYILLAPLSLCLIVLAIYPWPQEMPERWLHPIFTLVAGVALMAVTYAGLKWKETGRMCFLAFFCLLLGIRLLQFSALLPFEEYKRMEFKNGPAAAQSLVSQLPEGTRQVLVYAIDLRNAIYFYAKDIQFKKVPATSRELHEPNWVVMEETSFPSFKANVSSFKERGRLFYEGHKMVIVETGLDNLNEDSP